MHGLIFGGAPFTIGGWDTPDHSGYVRVQVFKFRDITDGLSNTLMLSETVQGEARTNPDMRGFVWWGYGSGFETYLGPNSSAPDVMQDGYYCDNGAPRNPPCVGPHTTQMPMTMAARSRHPGGVQAAMCDGSVNFISDDVQLDVWRAMSTSQGQEAITLPD